MATSSVATDAFSCSVRRGALTTAVELVEQGRAVFWTWLTRLRLPLDELSLSSDTGAALAKELQQLSFRLCSAFDKSTEDQSLDIQQLTMQWDDVVSRIRMMSAFSRFLLPPLFSDLRKAAEEGPVIIVNASWLDSSWDGASMRPVLGYCWHGSVSLSTELRLYEAGWTPPGMVPL
ncbi:uncharacterized protein F5147DRAFT_841240 [Suillus discolor]|uniref:Uncharacterized protein n=1 Tax=Suillus discolor TaxID=1912936 RepID=A0A9P7ETT1_9AGAM|nr:uncharacterized protein F5147DRAFT_841240 [Suillus discolor]KAG2088843.1 hypothetical protein F5147DRAFT_841240 [Suillus discolor]